MFCQSAPPASSPAPRLRARSMLSLGTEDFLAFWMASYRVGLPPGSPPPTRAATSMFLISLANILPRLASMTAFLCLVVAHLEWPLIRYYLYFSAESDPPSLLAQIGVDVTLDVGCDRGQHLVIGHRRDGFDPPDIAQHRQPDQLAGNQPAAAQPVCLVAAQR